MKIDLDIIDGRVVLQPNGDRHRGRVLRQLTERQRPARKAERYGPRCDRRAEVAARLVRSA
jgi:hypothetical protein